MTQSVYTQQAPSNFNLNQITKVADAPFKDKQALAQAELYSHLESQAEAVAPTQDPLTSRDRRIISEIIQVKPESVRTIWIEGGITVWVQFFNGGRLAFDRNWFATRVAEVKATLPETPRERNQRLETELKQACTVFGLYHGEIDYLVFSTKVYRHGQFVGFIGASEEGWYSNPRKYGLDRVGKTAQEAIALLGVRPLVAA